MRNTRRILVLLLSILFALFGLLSAMVRWGRARRRRSQAAMRLLSREVWKEKRSQHFWENTIPHWPEPKFVQTFRMSRPVFKYVVSLVEDEMSPNEITVRDPVPLDKRVAIAIYYLASGSVYRVVADVFGVGTSTVHKCVMLFCDALGKHVNEHIYMPDEKEAKEIAARVEIHEGFPQVMGMIDGTHIPVKPPQVGHRDYVNRKGWPSMVLQAVVDDRKRIRNISCCNPGIVHDAYVFRGSALDQNASLLPKCCKMLCGQAVPLLILGDPAYPIRNWLMKDYTGTNLPPRKENFCAYLSQSRITVEHTFGALKTRWRVCKKQMDYHCKIAPFVITACCILHNICENENFPLPEPIEVERNQPPTEQENEDDSDSSEASAIRDAIAQYLWENYPHKIRSF